MLTSWLRSRVLRMALLFGGLTVALSACHYHHGYLQGGYGYHGGGHHRGGDYRGHHRHHRYHGDRHGGWRGRY